MASISETGHAKNVAHFEDLIAHCVAYGTAYNPIGPHIQLTALQALLASAEAQLLATTAAKTALNTATNTREVAFQAIRKLSTRIVNAASTIAATPQTLADIKSINRKIHGQRSRKIEDDTTPDTTTPVTSVTGQPDVVAPTGNPAAHRHISASQRSFDQVIQHFTRLIQALTAEPLYAPNEPELQVATLATQLAGLHAANSAVIVAGVAYSNAVIARNNVLYDDAASLTNSAAEVKKYVKSVFGPDSPQYRQVNKIRFARPGV
jgi:hypothetical protein